MPNLLPVEVEGMTIYIETEPAYGSEDTTSFDDTVQKAADAFEHAKATVTSVAKSMAQAISKLDDAVTPNEFSLEFAIKFNAKGQAFLAEASAEAALKVSMTYHHKKAP